MAEEGVTGVRARQDPLCERYRVAPGEAVITDRARTRGGVDTDPFHGQVVIGDEAHGAVLPFGIHRAVGGYGDAPNPGDMLCAALATCLDSTIRIISDRLGVVLESLEVKVTAEVDVRGTLLVDKTVPVGFQSLRCDVAISATPGTNPRLIDKLVAASERCCINLQTLRSGVTVTTGVGG